MATNRKLVNEIANRAFITPESNQRFSDTLPGEYLPRVLEKHPEALSSQYIPENKELWKIENYEEFLAKRRDMLAHAINDYMKDLVFGTLEEPTETVDNMIEKGENPRIEFKETLLYDVFQNKANKNLKMEVAKEICAMANTEGGVVIIGVEDASKEVKGLERDYRILRNGQDEFELQLRQEIANRINELMSNTYTTVDFKEVNGKEVCVVYVEESPNPVYFRENGEQKFYVRDGTSSKPLSISEANDYIKINFS